MAENRRADFPRAAAGALVLVAILGYLLTLFVTYWGADR